MNFNPGVKIGYCSQKDWMAIQQMAKQLEIPILMTFDLNHKDTQNLLNEFPTTAGIERHITTFSFINSATVPHQKQASENQSPITEIELLTLQLKNTQTGQSSKVFLTHRIDYGYFQEG